MDDVLRAGPLVQVVHILRDDRHVEAVLQGGHEPMAFVGQGPIELLAQRVVEVVDERRVGFPAFV